MTFQDSYEATTPSTSKDKVPTGNPQPLVGYQKDPELKELQNPSPTHQPEDRRVRLSRELLSASESQQLDITAGDAVRLQRDVPATAEKTDPNLLKFKTLTNRGDPEAVRTLEKATIGAHYLRPFKREVFQPDRFPPWFEKLRFDLRICAKGRLPLHQAIAPAFQIEQKTSWPI